MLIAALFILSAWSNPQSPSCGQNSFERQLEQMSQCLSSDLAPECQDLKPGEHRDFEIPHNQSPTSMEHRYRLQKTIEGNYEVILNPIFFDQTKGEDEEITGDFDTSINTKWRKTAQDCLETIKGLARGPSGEKIEFKIYDGPQNKTAPPRVSIGIRDSGRAHARSWVKTNGCPTHVHELLHLTGLADEYPESAKGYVQDPITKKWKFVEEHAEKTAYDCRKIYEKSSIMANEEIAFADLFAPGELKIVFCQCAQADGCKDFFDKQQENFQEMTRKGPQALQEMKITYPSECPRGFAPSKYSQNFSIPKEIKNQMDAGQNIGFPIPPEIPPGELAKMTRSFSFKKKSPETSRNLLEPRHFDAIVFPGCFSKNRQYYQDSQNAYRTSQSHGGNGCFNYDWMNWKKSEDKFLDKFGVEKPKSSREEAREEAKKEEKEEERKKAAEELRLQRKTMQKQK